VALERRLESQQNASRKQSNDDPLHCGQVIVLLICLLKKVNFSLKESS
jgi:hypothetical protein